MRSPHRVRDGKRMSREGLGRLNQMWARTTTAATRPTLIRDGKLVVEEYFPRQEGDKREQALKRVSPHEQHSATKSVNAILIGIAIDQHQIRGVDEKVSTFFPEYADIFAGDKDKLRLKDLLTMCVETDESPAERSASIPASHQWGTRRGRLSFA